MTQDHDSTSLREPGRILRLVMTALLVGAFAVIVEGLRLLEGNRLFVLLPVLVVGFPIHAILPRSARPWFFLLLFAVSLQWLFGWEHGIILAAIGLGLFLICHLPIAFSLRVGLVLAIGITMAVLRSSFTAIPWVANIMPFLASMFMFRLVLYLYDLRHGKIRGSLPRRLGYFFMFPNLCFPLYPTVDSQAFERGYEKGDRFSVYEKGVVWIFRGMVQLLLYRAVYHFLLPAPSSVTDVHRFFIFASCSYLIYLRFSGLFHILTGILCLFGNNLPRTHDEYLLTSSFTDYWRRINIYWKDFMAKVVFYPTTTWLRRRRWSLNAATLAAVPVVFVATWVLHSYQWFWLRGRFPIHSTDIVFWGVFGIVLMINTAFDLRPKRAVAASRTRIDPALLLTFKTMGMWLFISLHWSLWSTPTLREWFAMWKVTATSEPKHYLWVLLELAGFGLVTYVWRKIRPRLPGRALQGGGRNTRADLGYAVAVAALVLLACIPDVQQWLHLNRPTVARAMLNERFNERDEELFELGYYETLIGSDQFGYERWRVEMTKPRDWGKPDEMRLSTGDLLLWRLQPSVEMVFKRAPFRTNQWGMRDEEVTLEKPEGTFRIALLGASYVVGGGVDVEKIFAHVLEEQLAGAIDPAFHKDVEVLNFAVGGYDVLRQRMLFEETVLRFQPDATVFIVHNTESIKAVHQLAMAVREGLSIPYPFLRQVAQDAGVTPGMSEGEMERLLMPRQYELVSWAYEGIAELAREHDVRPVWTYLRQTAEELIDEENLERTRSLAGEAGFETIALVDVYRDLDTQLIQVAPWDRHPNVRGHSLIASGLFSELSRLAPRLGLHLVPQAVNGEGVSDSGAAVPAARGIPARP